jgi:hypothetical protein
LDHEGVQIAPNHGRKVQRALPGVRRGLVFGLVPGSILHRGGPFVGVSIPPELRSGTDEAATPISAYVNSERDIPVPGSETFSFLEIGAATSPVERLEQIVRSKAPSVRVGTRHNV